MRHRVSTKKMNRAKGPRSALKYALFKALIENNSVKTTTPKAKFVKPLLEKLVTKAKRGSTLENRRYLLSKLRNNKELVEKLVSDIAKKYEDRNGGYLRIQKSLNRVGDNAKMAVISWVVSESKPVDTALTETKEVEPKKKSTVKKKSVGTTRVKKSKVAKVTAKK